MAIPSHNLRYQTLSLKFGQVYKYTYWENMNKHNEKTKSHAQYQMTAVSTTVHYQLLIK